MKIVDYQKYKIRRCTSLHFCEICKGRIEYGHRYYDGGYGKRAHDLCADADALEREEAAKLTAATVDYYKDENE